MEDKVFTNQKFILQVIMLLILTGLLFGALKLIDKYHERYIQLKLAELDATYEKETNYERK